MLMRSHRMACLSFVLLLACVYPDSVFASTGSGDLPWSSPGQRLVNFISGDFVRWALTAITVMLGLGFMFDEDRMHKWLGRGARYVIGGFAVASVITWALPFFGVGGGALLP
jgi:type IV secretory pathway VirB2 component (pilin)